MNADTIAAARKAAATPSARANSQRPPTLKLRRGARGEDSSAAAGVVAVSSAGVMPSSTFVTVLASGFWLLASGFWLLLDDDQQPPCFDRRARFDRDFPDR